MDKPALAGDRGEHNAPAMAGHHGEKVNTTYHMGHTASALPGGMLNIIIVNNWGTATQYLSLQCDTAKPPHK